LKNKIIVIGLLLIPLSLFLPAMKSAPEVPYTISQKNSAGEKVYKKYCISCHQEDGGGVPHLNPPLINTSYVLGEKERLIKIVLHGLNENIEIDDETFSNAMPALSILKDQQIADVLTFVRSSFGNKASAITAAEVKAVRSKKK
jgi:mono/diheme cytochrome c family protein